MSKRKVFPLVVFSIFSLMGLIYRTAHSQDQSATIGGGSPERDSNAIALIEPQMTKQPSHTTLDLNINPVRIYSQLQTITPAPGAATRFPLGNDLALTSFGPADIHLATEPFEVTSNTSVGPGVSSINVSSPLLNGSPLPGNATSRFAPVAGLIVEPGSANEEFVTRFSITSGAQLTVLFKKAHNQPFKIRQQGVLIIDGWGLKPAADPSGQNHFFRFFDSIGRPVFQVPIVASATFPDNAPQFPAVITGANGPRKDLLFRNNNANSIFRLIDSTNTHALLTINDVGNATFTGNVAVLGTLFKSAGSFKIDHPLDPLHKYLLHSFVESPDMMNIYNGMVTLDEKGEAEVKLPSYFEALNQDFRYQLTCVGAYAPIYIASKIKQNSFHIAGGKPRMEVSWQVTGIRHDDYAVANRIQVEEEKPLSERGHYLNPEPFPAPAVETSARVRPE